MLQTLSSTCPNNFGIFFPDHSQNFQNSNRLPLIINSLFIITGGARSAASLASTSRHYSKSIDIGEPEDEEEASFATEQLRKAVRKNALGGASAAGVGVAGPGPGSARLQVRFTLVSVTLIVVTF